MNPFGNFKFNQYQEQFAPLPAQDIIKASAQLRKEADMNEAALNKIDQQIQSINVFDEDSYLKKAQLEEIKRVYEQAQESGAWEHAGRLIREVARNHAGNQQLKAAQQNYQAYQQLVKEANEMDVSIYQLAKLQKLRKEYQGAGSADEFGKYKSIGSVNFYEEDDIMKDVSEFLKGAKASKQILPSQKQGVWIIDATKEEIREEDLMKYGLEMILQNPQYARQMRDMAMYEATGGDLTKDVSNEELSDAYSKVAMGLTSPAAGAYSYTDYNMKRTGDALAIDAVKRSRDQADQSIVGISEITPTEVPTFEENVESLKSIEAEIAQTQKQIDREGGAVNQQLADKMDGLQQQKAKMTETVNQEIDNIVGEMNSAYGLTGKNKITREIYKDMMVNYEDKTGWGAGFKGIWEGVKALVYDMTPMGIQSSSASGKSASKMREEKAKSDQEYYNTAFTEEQRKAFDLYHGRGGRYALPKRTSKTRKGQYEEAKTKSRDSEVLYFTQKESKSFAPYIMQEAMNDNAVTTDGERIDREEMEGYKLDNTRNAGVYSTKINGKEYLQVPVTNEDGEQKTILVDGSQIRSDGGTLYTHGQNIIQQRVDNLNQNMGNLNTFGQQQAKTFINAAQPVIDPRASEFTDFTQEVNNLRPRTQTTAGRTYGMTSYGSTEMKIGNTGFISMNRIGESGTGFYLGSKSSGGQEYIFSFDDNTGNDKYGKQNGIVTDYINIEGTSNMQTNTNSAAKGKRLANLENAIQSIDSVPSSTNVSNFHTLSKLSEYSRNNNVSLTEADVNQINEITPALVSVLETNGYSVSVPELDINDSKSVNETISFYQQTLQLIATQYGKQ